LPVVEQTRRSRRASRRRPWIIAVAALVGLVVVGLGIWGITAIVQGSGRPGEDVKAASYAKGNCFADFDATADSNRRVGCTDPHSAQLVDQANVSDADAYPGREALEARAKDLCDKASLNLPADPSKLKKRYTYPTQEGWGGGDRRIDCYIESTDGNTLTASLLP
jgi:hypothetical protein